MNSLADQVFHDLTLAIENDELLLPTLPEVALRVREAAEDPMASIQTLGRVIGNDTALTARIIKVVNSPLFRISTEVRDLQTAVARLGVVYTSNLAIGLAMEQMFQATTDTVDHKMRQVWNKSTEVAGICNVLCRHYTNLKPDQAMLAGLVHLIGVLPILTYAETCDALQADPDSLEAVIERLHPLIGDKLLRSWQFPESLAQVPGSWTNLARDSEQVDYVDIVQVAVIQSYLGSDHPFAQIDWRQVPAFEKLGFDLDALRQEDEDLSAAMDAAMAMLQ